MNGSKQINEQKNVKNKKNQIAIDFVLLQCNNNNKKPNGKSCNSRRLNILRRGVVEAYTFSVIFSIGIDLGKQ